MTLQELLQKRKADALTCVCPQCAAINELCARITLAKRNPDLTDKIPVWEDGIKKLKALKIKGVQSIMDSMPVVATAIVEEENR